MTPAAKFGKLGILLEAEVSPRSQSRFEARYHNATGVVVSPGSPRNYQSQSNKWGSELRVYFNDPGMAAVLRGIGVHIEHSRTGYMAETYKYRVNDNKLWWKLVEVSGLRLGVN